MNSFDAAKEIPVLQEPTTNTLKFKKLEIDDIAILAPFYKNCYYEICEHTIGTNIMWQDTLNPSWCIVENCLIFKFHSNGHDRFCFPVPKCGESTTPALDAIDLYCLANGITLTFTAVPKSALSAITERYDYTHISDNRSWRDYIYLSDDLQNFAGRGYQGQRNHINKFRSLYGDAIFRPLNYDDREYINAFWAEYEEEFSKHNDKYAATELKIAKYIFTLPFKDYFLSGGIFFENKLLGLSLAEKCGNTLIIHIEKALYSYTGIYPALVQQFARYYGNDVKYLNREDDVQDKGLRTSKLQYRPTKLASKYYITVENELYALSKIPTIKTERLVLSEITESDAPIYNALICDRKNNFYWNDDEIKNVNGTIEENTFVNFVKENYSKRVSLSLAVRLDGKMIGEIILYAFDGKGSAELGCRIAKEFHGNGYGIEAFCATLDFALYKLNLLKVIAKCFKENKSSYKMLSSCMRKDGSDNTFYYFEKTN